MGAPVAAAAALANTRTGRKIVTGVIFALLLLIAIVITPLLAIPFAIAGSAASAALTTTDGAPPDGQRGLGVPARGRVLQGPRVRIQPRRRVQLLLHEPHGLRHGPGMRRHDLRGRPGHGDHRRAATRGTGTRSASTTATAWSPSTGTCSGPRSASPSARPVTAGTPLGAEGNTGKSFGCHLHFEVQKSGTPVDPEPFMAALGLPLR